MTNAAGNWNLVLASSLMYWQSQYATTNLLNRSATAILDGAWHHVAFTRASGSNRMFFDGVLQGAGEFTYQAKSMVVSVFCAFIMFAIIEYTSFGQEVLTGNDNDTLVHVWYALITLQTMRGITSLIKVVDKTGPIDLFGKLIT